MNERESAAIDRGQANAIDSFFWLLLLPCLSSPGDSFRYSEREEAFVESDEEKQKRSRDERREEKERRDERRSFFFLRSLRPQPQSLDLSKKKTSLQVKADTDWVQLLQDNPWLSRTKLVVKPDMLFGKRGKNGK